MRRHERAITDKAELEAVVAGATVVNLAMVDDGRPYVVPMNYGYANGCLYLHSAAEGRKVCILRRNPAVCFNLFIDAAIISGSGSSGCSFTSRYRSVIGEGRVEFLDGDDAKRHGLDIILAHYAGGQFMYRPEALARTCVFRVVIEAMTGKKANVSE